ncbi:MAG TPA: DUF1844 domain-containing protein [Candidatus Marinimicrobia bacterium]|jgi:hypothetical protein|nr:hypothetical protein [Candidatus Neomarinimicrobiota bacterium]MDP6276098.1 DUF1844 domain-containing protein [Candidatus Neomarinimicrobiota bacterium]MDP7217429.1 DUF1844 domain-containing protein [Candidatus Neomarinimicrobiota bacterium]MDP7436602.1 DUF1844 domain-containing protein [Candidatus Neomarinimicrobiota bacterium]HBN45298.1 hypothetical protein [Candidatus Neomarinimicrobiota bacterium]|tara:strand:+ start:14570 stop:14977 length:408 start_codon:yes stop_codon:yes gene_type:complete
MSTDKKYTEQQLFDQLISSLVHSAWVFLGKIKNPVNDELERNLDQASVQIDMLDMLYKRMKGNLTDNEDQYLEHLVRELKMNFVEEKNKKTKNGESMEDGQGKMKKGEDTDDTEKTDKPETDGTTMNDEKNEEDK